jgi:hypothetical protein
MRKFGVMIPDAEMVRMSTLSRKTEIAKQLENAPDPEVADAQKEQLILTNETMKKTIEELEGKIKEKDSEVLKQVADVAVLIAANPKLAPIMDALMLTVGKDTKEEQGEGANEMPVPPQQNPGTQPSLGQPIQ